MNYSGADTNRLRQLAVEGEQMLTVIAEARSMLRSLQTELPAVWVGDDSARFVGEIASVHTPAINRAEVRLSAAVDAIRRNAQRQDEVSGRLD